MLLNASVCPCESPPPLSGVSGVMLTSLIGTLLKGACDIGNPGDYPPNTSTAIEEFDFVIVGGGAGGSVLASRLSQAPHNFTVALLEAGGDPPADSDVPALQNLQLTDYDWQYRTEPQSNAFLGLNENRCLWPRGKVLGGSTVLNAMIYIRGHKNDYDNWAAEGNLGWDYASVLPYFKRSENIQIENLRNSTYHSAQGPLPVSNFKEFPQIMQDLLDASAQSSSRNKDMNGVRQSGFGRVQVTALDSVRFNAAKAFLEPRSNLFVFKKSQATRVIFEGSTAAGVQFVRDGVQHVVRARKEVILSAGAIGTPHLLMLSGVGPAEHLRALNISVVKGLSGVGRNMQDHSQFLGATFSTPHQPQNHDDDVFQYFRHRRGPLSTSGALNSVTGFISTEFAASRDYPDVQMHFHGPFRNSTEVEQFAKMIGLQDDYTAALFAPLLEEGRDVFIMAPILLRPESSGHLELQSTDPMQHPKIFANFFARPQDVNVLASGAMWSLRVAQRLSQTSRAGVRLNAAKVPGCRQHNLYSSRYWRCAVRHTAATTFHVAGTCKMGPARDPTAVVDSQLKVHGVKSLRVVDASVMPKIVSGNTMAPVYMIAEKAADFITAAWTRSKSQHILQL